MHFDSHRITIVVPLRIPEGGGSLVAFPMLRKEPSFELANLIEKLWYRLFMSQRGIDRLASRNRFLVADFVDKRPLIFLGRRTFHGNYPFEGEDERVTCLIHAFDPHEGVGVGHWVRKLRAAWSR